MADNMETCDLPTVSLTADKIDMYTMGVPKKLRHFLKFECAINWCPRGVYKSYRDRGTDLTIALYRRHELEETRKSYGEGHPALALRSG